MFEDLNVKEKHVLELFKKEEVSKDYDIQDDLKIFDPTEEILLSLIDKGYINASIRVGLHEDKQIQFDYTINGHKLTNYALDCFGIKEDVVK